jgi:lantibiotic biosynthesis protein
VGRTLWLAGAALDEPELARLAEQAVRAAVERQRKDRPLRAPTLCHGTAGLAQVTLRMAADSGAEDLSREARMLCLDLLERFDPDAPLGYRGEAQMRDLPNATVDDPDLLDGAAGPPLVLLAAATDTDPGWDRALLLS